MKLFKMGSTLAPMGANLELTSIEEGGNKEELLPLKVYSFTLKCYLLIIEVIKASYRKNSKNWDT